MGILDDADVSGNEVPKDPFGFGNDYWEVSLLEFRRPRPSSELSIEEQEKLKAERPHADISSSGKQYGGMAVFRVHAPQYQHLGANDPNQMPGQLGRNGQWFQLPSPMWARNQVPFDKNSAEGKKLIHAWGSLCKAAGIPADKIASADFQDIIGKTFLAKIYAKEDENGYWQFRVAGWKEGRAPSDGSGISEFTQGGQSNAAGSAMSEMEKAMLAARREKEMKDEVDNA